MVYKKVKKYTTNLEKKSMSPSGALQCFDFSPREGGREMGNAIEP